MPNPARHQIGLFDFLALHGQPLGIAHELELEMRPGVDGTQLTDTGQRGQPFELVSHRDAKDYAAGCKLLDEYKQAIELDPLVLTKDNVRSIDRKPPYRVQILRVDEVQLRAIQTPVGAIDPGATALLVARWTLIAIEGAGNRNRP